MSKVAVGVREGDTLHPSQGGSQEGGYPASEARGHRETPSSEVRRGRNTPVPEARAAAGRATQARGQGRRAGSSPAVTVAAQAQEGLKELSAGERQEQWR